MLNSNESHDTHNKKFYHNLCKSALDKPHYMYLKEAQKVSSFHNDKDWSARIQNILTRFICGVKKFGCKWYLTISKCIFWYLDTFKYN